MRPIVCRPMARGLATVAPRAAKQYQHPFPAKGSELCSIRTAEAAESVLLPAGLPPRAKEMVGEGLDRADFFESRDCLVFVTGQNHHNAAIVDLMAGLEKQFFPQQHSPSVLPLRLPGQHADFPNVDAWLNARSLEHEGELVCLKRFHRNTLEDNVSLTYYLRYNTNFTIIDGQIETLFRLCLPATEPEALTLRRNLSKRALKIAADRQEANALGVLNIVAISRELAFDRQRTPIYRSHECGFLCGPRHILDGSLEDRPSPRCPHNEELEYRIMGSALATERAHIHVERISPFPELDADSRVLMMSLARLWKLYASLRHHEAHRAEIATSLAKAKTDEELDQVEARYGC